MNTSIKNIVASLLITATLISCGYGGETLQGYYVVNQEAPNFISVDIPVSFVNLDDAKLTDVQREAYESIDKLNMLGYRKTDDNIEEYKAELVKVQTILKDERYQELFRGGNSSDGKIIVKYIGTDTSIDELIIFGTMNEAGFGIIRVLGNNMEPAKIMKLGEVVNQMSSEENTVEDFMQFFRPGSSGSDIEDFSEVFD
ncbi:DUF4252 domain-containing protein [Pontimicrobium sp. SW4]|uniref:DUF4252 domain-containing protein n=1 Tax=Pontimicrobium sp. SW4 TaxID=3153519 RepID=A0AAU7BVW8_9FLAO